VDITRRDFCRKMGLAGGAGLLGLTGGTFLLKACSPEEEVKETGDKVKPDQPQPAYARLAEEGKLSERVEKAYQKLENCELCPRRCGVNRLNGETGFCNSTDQLIVHSHTPHFGEERPLVGTNGSGTIFFSNCNLRCVFCQNWPLAHKGKGEEYSDDDLADMMLDLQARGCHNINLVTPTHVMPHILNAVKKALEKGLYLPLCYNTGGYELEENIQLLDGIVDIYLPDLKFMDGEMSDKYIVRGATDYPESAQESIKEMHRQVGVLSRDEDGIAKRGLMLRHLVMPNRVSSPREFVYWVAEHLPKDTYVNIMAQYRVAHQAYDYEKIDEAIEPEEFIEAMEWAKEAGLTKLDKRSLENLERFRRKLN